MILKLKNVMVSIGTLTIAFLRYLPSLSIKNSGKEMVEGDKKTKVKYGKFYHHLGRTS